VIQPLGDGEGRINKALRQERNRERAEKEKIKIKGPDFDNSRKIEARPGKEMRGEALSSGQG